MDLSFLGGGLFVIPCGLLVAAIVSFIRGYKQSKSGSLERGPGNSTIESDINVSFWKCSGTVYGIILFLAAIGSFIWMWADR